MAEFYINDVLFLYIFVLYGFGRPPMRGLTKTMVQCCKGLGLNRQWVHLLFWILGSIFISITTAILIPAYRIYRFVLLLIYSYQEEDDLDDTWLETVWFRILLIVISLVATYEVVNS